MKVRSAVLTSMRRPATAVTLSSHPRPFLSHHPASAPPPETTAQQPIAAALRVSSLAPARATVLPLVTWISGLAKMDLLVISRLSLLHSAHVIHSPPNSISIKMAAAGMPRCSLKYPKPSFSHKTLQDPRSNRLFMIDLTSKLGFVAQHQRKLVAKARSLSNSKLNSRSPVSIRKSDEPIIVIDNYDSFTYNLCQYLGELGCKFQVYRNDELTVEELKSKQPRGVLISPGPGTPQDSGISLQTVLELGPVVPLFGVCMGLQCIGEAFGGKIVRSPYGVMHGKSSPVYYDEKGEDGLFSGLSNPFTAGRYHSLVIDKESFPGEVLEVTAWTEDGLIMAARHKTYKHLQGVQFHPESIITNEGMTIVRNFVRLIETKEAEAQN